MCYLISAVPYGNCHWYMILWMWFYKLSSLIFGYSKTVKHKKINMTYNNHNKHINFSLYRVKEWENFINVPGTVSEAQLNIKECNYSLRYH